MIHSGKLQELPETFLNIHETFMGHSGDFQVTFKTHSDKINVTFRLDINCQAQFQFQSNSVELR